MRKQVLLGACILGAFLLAAACAPAAPAAPAAEATSAPTLVLPSATALAPTDTPTVAVTATPTVVATSTPLPATASPTALPTSTQVPTPAPAAGAAPGGNYADTIVGSLRAYVNAPASRLTVRSTDASGRTYQSVIEIVNPDRMHVNLPGAEIIAIRGQGLWQKANGQWTKSFIDLSGTVFAFRDRQVVDVLINGILASQPQLAVTDTLDGRATTVYEFATKMPDLGTGQGDVDGTFKIWIGTADGLPYRIEGESDAGAAQAAKTTMIATFEYSPDIKIEPPM